MSPLSMDGHSDSSFTRIETRRGRQSFITQETPPIKRGRSLKCEECKKSFFNARKFENHVVSHRPKEEPIPGEMQLNHSWYSENLVLEPQNTEEQGEFIVDSLYLTQDRKLHCHSRGETCFKTGSIKEMIRHRELLHPLLEKRFSYNVWSEAVPEDLDDNDSNNNDSVTSDLNTSEEAPNSHNTSMRQFWIQQLIGRS